MTEMQKRYTEARVNQRLGHYAALHALAVETGLDVGTVDRVLKRAAKADEIDARREA